MGSGRGYQHCHQCWLVATRTHLAMVVTKLVLISADRLPPELRLSRLRPRLKCIMRAFIYAAFLDLS
jgi:hypothetical protein